MVQDGLRQSVATLSSGLVESGHPCAWCGGSLAGRRPHARYCSPACRHRAFVRRRGCPRCRGHLVLDPATVDLPALDDAVTLAAVAELNTMGSARVYAARLALSCLVRLLGSSA
jgi:hypothetical protein